MYVRFIVNELFAGAKKLSPPVAVLASISENLTPFLNYIKQKLCKKIDFFNPFDSISHLSDNMVYS